MNSEIKEISQCVREIHLTVEADRAESDYQTVLKEFSKYAVVPGFRKGKAPIVMVEQMFGSHAREEFLERKLQDYYVEAIDALDQHPVTEGKPVTFDWDRGKDLTATFRFEIKPEIEIKQYLNLEIPFEPTLITDDLINGEIEHIREHSGTVEPVEGPVEKEDIASIEITLPQKEGEDVAKINREIPVGGEMYAPELHEHLLGAKIGDEFTSLIVVTDKEDSTFHNPLSIKVVGIKRNFKPELNDDFAKDIGYENLEEMRAKITEEITHQVEINNKRELKQAIVAKLVELNPFEVPPSAVDHYAHEMAENYAKERGGDTERMMPLYKIFAEQEFKKYYILDKLKQIETIEVTDSERTAMIAEMAENVGITPEEYKDRYAAQIESEDFTDAIVENMLFDRIRESSTLVKPKPAEAEQAETGESKE